MISRSAAHGCLCALLFLAFGALRAAEPTPANTLLLEPEQFAALGPWQRTGNMIQSSNMPATALAGFQVKEAGSWRVWTRSRDYLASDPGARRFLIKINERPAQRESGTHGQPGLDGWWWEQVGTFDLKSGLHLVEIEDTARFFGRLEAILLTKTDFDPNKLPRHQLARFLAPPVQAERIEDGAEPAVAPPSPGATPLASLSNARLVIEFHATQDAAGQSRIWRSTRFHDSALRHEAGAEELLLLHNSANNASFEAYFPSWKTNAEALWRVGERVLRRPADSRNPFDAGQPHRLHPTRVEQRGERVVIVHYTDGRGQEASATWELPAEGWTARVTANFTAPEAGWISLAFANGAPVSRDDVAAVQLPPLHQFRRLPDSPSMITVSMTPHPLALVETRAGLTYGLVADPAKISGEWASRDNAPAGFTLRDRLNRVRPVHFAPVLGGPGSQVAAGQSVESSWLVVAAPKPWFEVMRHVDIDVYGLKDYREPVGTSTTDQALNIIQLLREDEASGWDELLKGPGNIESPRTATHASPLTYLSVARLTRDADFFERRARPTVEWLLSRPGQHFALNTENNLYVTAATARLSANHVSYGSAVFQGAHQLTGQLNPWLGDLGHQDGKARPTRNNSSEPGWSGLLALHRQNPDPALLRRITHEANGWLGRIFQMNMDVTRGLQPFYNTSFYPYWWDLVELHQLTGDARYLDAAKAGAAQTVAGLWVSPPVRDESITLNPTGKLEGYHHIWWQGQDRWRLGWGVLPQDTGHKAFASFDVAPKTVPSWTVSVVGLGLEQPITYFGAADKMANILLSAWSPHLLRLHGATGDDYWRTFARNSLIGRGASYPGYYVSDHMDLYLAPDYVRKGPDLTGLYWHHIPVHLAMLVDYIFADAEVRSAGQIRFPFSVQQGYVWFTSRVYGGAPGKVFDDEAAWPWLDRERFRVDNHRVDFFGARSREQFHLVVMNQGREETSAPVRLDLAGLGIAPGTAPRLRGSLGERALKAGADGSYELNLPRYGYAVLSFAAAPEELWPELSPVKAPPVRLALPGGWGEAHAYRLRSPFGRDSIYAMLTTGAESGRAEFEFEIAGQDAKRVSVDAFPFEHTLRELAMGADVRLRLHLTGDDGKTIVTEWMKLPGNE